MDFGPTCCSCGCYLTASFAQAEKEREIMKDRVQNNKLKNRAKRRRVSNARTLLTAALSHINQPLLRGSCGSQPGDVAAPTRAILMNKAFILFTQVIDWPSWNILEEQRATRLVLWAWAQRAPINLTFSVSVPILQDEPWDPATYP